MKVMPPKLGQKRTHTILLYTHVDIALIHNCVRVLEFIELINLHRAANTEYSHMETIYIHCSNLLHTMSSAVVKLHSCLLLISLVPYSREHYFPYR